MIRPEVKLPSPRTSCTLIQSNLGVLSRPYPSSSWCESKEFWRDIPPLVAYGENSLRLAVVLPPFLMPLEVATVAQRRGLLLFVVGTVLYFLAWVALMIFPQSRWSTSQLGFLAPAYTPLVWLAGVGLIGRRLYWPSPYRWWVYIGLACGFVVLHVTHASILYSRNYNRHAP